MIPLSDPDDICCEIEHARMSFRGGEDDGGL